MFLGLFLRYRSRLQLTDKYESTNRILWSWSKIELAENREDWIKIRETFALQRDTMISRYARNSKGGINCLIPPLEREEGPIVLFRSKLICRRKKKIVILRHKYETDFEFKMPRQKLCYGCILRGWRKSLNCGR